MSRCPRCFNGAGVHHPGDTGDLSHEPTSIEASMVPGFITPVILPSDTLAKYQGVIRPCARTPA